MFMSPEVWDFPGFVVDRLAPAQRADVYAPGPAILEVCRLLAFTLFMLLREK